MRRETVTALPEALGAGRGDLVSLVGGGGKTTLMYRLGGDLRQRRLRVAAATTTKIAVPGPGEDGTLLCADSWEGLVGRLTEDVGGLPVLGRAVLSSGKVDGIPPEWCDRLLGDGLLEALVVEADGAARKPVKAPEAWEPVVPARTTLFAAVVGLSCLGKPLGAEHAFRPERVAAAAGMALGARIEAKALGRLLLSREGLLKGAPPGARCAAVLNQAELPDAAEAAREVASLLLGSGSPYERVLVCSLREKATRFEVAFQ